MTSTLQRLIDALRDELQQYGEVLGWLDSRVRLASDACSSAGVTLQAQAESLLALRARRDTLQQQLAWACQRPDAGTPSELLPLVAEEVRPLLRALFEENDSLRRQLGERLRQDHPWPGSTPLIAQLLAVDPPQNTTPDNLIVLGAFSASA